jgi:hypothetical protein
MKKKKKGRQTERERENQNKKKVQFEAVELPLHTSIKSKRTPICSVGLGEREIETT